MILGSDQENPLQRLKLCLKKNHLQINFVVGMFYAMSEALSVDINSIESSEKFRLCTLTNQKCILCATVFTVSDSVVQRPRS